MRVVLAGFGPFPGAPVNPSALLVKALARRRRPALAGHRSHRARIRHELRGGRSRSAETIARKSRTSCWCLGSPAARRQLCIETRARNAVSVLFPDAAAYVRGRASSSLAGRRRSPAMRPSRGSLAQRGHEGAGAAVARCRTISVQLRLLAALRARAEGPAAGPVRPYPGRSSDPQRKRRKSRRRHCRFADVIRAAESRSDRAHRRKPPIATARGASASVTFTAPTSKPFQLRNTGCARSARATARSASLERQEARDDRRHDRLRAARPAPSSHLMAMPKSLFRQRAAIDAFGAGFHKRPARRRSA